MAQEVEKISYSDGSVTHLAETIIVKQNAPGDLILPAWTGIDAEARNAAIDLATQGYNVIIAAISGTTDTPKNMESAKKMSAFYNENPDKYRHKIQLAFNEFTKLGTHKNKTAVIGYCFGGTGAVEAARGN